MPKRIGNAGARRKLSKLGRIAKKQNVTVHVNNILYYKKCEDCKLKQPCFGLPEGKTRWCAGCSKAHAGAVDLVNKKCEDCHLKQPSFGLLAEMKKRWCSGCAKVHTGAVNVVSQKCEDCKLKQPNFGHFSDRKRR